MNDLLARIQRLFNIKYRVTVITAVPCGDFWEQAGACPSILHPCSSPTSSPLFAHPPEAYPLLPIQAWHFLMAEESELTAKERHSRKCHTAGGQRQILKTLQELFSQGKLGRFFKRGSQLSGLNVQILCTLT